MFLLIYTALLFFLLSPNVLLRLPSNGNKYVVAIVHSIVFVLIWHFTNKSVLRFMRIEGFAEGDNCGTAVKEGQLSEDKKLKCVKKQWVLADQK